MHAHHSPWDLPCRIFLFSWWFNSVCLPWDRLTASMSSLAVSVVWWPGQHLWLSAVAGFQVPCFLPLGSLITGCVVLFPIVPWLFCEWSETPNSDSMSLPILNNQTVATVLIASSITPMARWRSHQEEDTLAITKLRMLLIPTRWQCLPVCVVAHSPS